MEIKVDLDDDLLKIARELSGIKDESVLAERGLETIIVQEEARRRFERERSRPSPGKGPSKPK